MGPDTPAFQHMAILRDIDEDAMFDRQTIVATAALWAAAALWFAFFAPGAEPFDQPHRQPPSTASQAR